MAMLSSYTLLSSRPAPYLPGIKFSRAARLPAATVVSLPRAPPAVPAFFISSSRWAHPFFVCRAQKNTLDVNTNALVNRDHKVVGSGWRIDEDNNHITIKLQVLEQQMTKVQLDIKVTEEQELIIKHKEDESKLYVCLRVPPGYDSNKVAAKDVGSGWLHITLAKPNLETKQVDIS